MKDTTKLRKPVTVDDLISYILSLTPAQTKKICERLDDVKRQLMEEKTT